jgi:hypothetical protein
MVPDTLGYVVRRCPYGLFNRVTLSSRNHPSSRTLTEASPYRIVRNEPIMASTLRTWAGLFYRIGLEWVGGDPRFSAVRAGSRPFVV